MIENILAEYRELIEKRIDELLPQSTTEYSVVNDAARYSLMLGGKRIRPILMLEFCRLCGGSVTDALDFAIALEMIHSYSLVHDDLPCMDNDDIRRGKPSCHKKFGEDIALLAGDALLTAAFSVAAKAKVSTEKSVKAIAVLADMSGIDGMIGGQAIDLAFEKMKPQADSLKEMYLKKTGCLLIAAAKIGCILAGADENDINNAESYAANLGLAFQIIDDILDLTADTAVLGKPVGSDIKNEKTTFPSIYGLTKASEIAAEFTDNALSALNNFNGDTETLKELTKFLLHRKY